MQCAAKSLHARSYGALRYVRCGAEHIETMESTWVNMKLRRHSVGDQPPGVTDILIQQDFKLCGINIGRRQPRQ